MPQYSFNDEESIFETDDVQIAGKNVGHIQDETVYADEMEYAQHYTPRHKKNPQKRRNVTLIFAGAAVVALSIMLCTAIIFFSNVARVNKVRENVDNTIQKNQELQEQYAAAQQEIKDLDEQIASLQNKISKMSD